MNHSEKPLQIIIFLFRIVLGNDKRFFYILFGYSIAISILSLALPISIQSLINTITNTAMVSPLFTLTMALLVLLGLSSVINGLKTLLSEQFQQQFFSKMVAEISLRCSYASYQSLESMNRGELMNKFFEIVTVQKSVPYLVIGVFFIALQTLVGIIVSSLYHPFYFAFNILLLTSLFFGLKWHFNNATYYAIKESSKKHDLASWLQQLGRSHHLFKSKASKIFASKKSAEILKDYIHYRKSHFKHLFSQISFLLVMYTVLNAILLFISGYLVLKGQLTLGQLVATEVIFTSIFVNFYKAGNYLESFYDVVASSYKLKSFFNLDLESTAGDIIDRPTSLRFKDAVYTFKKDSVSLNFEFNSGKKYLVKTTSSSLKKLLTDAIMGYISPNSGFMVINQSLMSDLNLHHYRDYVSTVDSEILLECSVREYLTLSNHEQSDLTLIEALKTVDLYASFESQGFNLDTHLAPSGYPLSRTDVFKLKMAKCILDAPSIVILNDYTTEFTLDNTFLQHWIHSLSSDTMVIILESEVLSDCKFDEVIHLDGQGLSKNA
jgi:putative ABC transport system ATP-binding protein